MAGSIKKSYIHSCKSLKTEPLSSVKVACRRVIDGSLNFSSVYLAEDQCQAVGIALVKCAGISELCLADCLIRDQGLSCVIGGFNCLSKLDLKGNELIDCGNELGSFLKTTKCLKHLSLEWNAIGSSEPSLAALSEGVAVNMTLVYLNLSNNQISHCGASFISSALITNEALVELDLRWNNISVIGGRQLLSSLKLNSRLEELHLAGNNVTNDILEAIATALLVKSKHYQAEKDWTVQREILQSRSELKEKETDMKLSTLYDQLDEMRLSSVGITERACEEIVTYKSEIEACYAKITLLEDQLLTAKFALESIEEKHSLLQDDHQLLALEKEKNDVTLNNKLTAKEQEVLSMKEQIKELKEQQTDAQHSLQQQNKLAAMEKESADELVIRLKEELHAVKEAKASRVKELEEEIDSLSNIKAEQLKNAKFTHQLEMSQNQAIWDKEKTVQNEQLQISLLRFKELQQEYEEFTAQTKAEKLKSKQQTDQLKKELQMKHSTEILELNQRFKDLHGKYESVKAELDETKLKLSVAKSDKDGMEEQLRQKNVKYSEAIRANDDQQTKILAMINKHSKESEELMQQRNQFEQLYDQHKRLLHKAKEENHVLKSDLEKETDEWSKEKSQLQQALQHAKQQLQFFKEQEEERTRQLKKALETYILSASSC